MSRHRKKKVESTVPSTYNYNQVRTAKAKLISEEIFGILNSSKNRTKKFDLINYYDTSGRLVFVN